jgi:translation elongation factor EF-4
LQAGKKYDVLEVGVHNPEEVPVDVLLEGQVGWVWRHSFEPMLMFRYVVCNMKNSDEGECCGPFSTSLRAQLSAHIGDTICHEGKLVEALPGFKPMKAMVS